MPRPKMVSKYPPIIMLCLLLVDLSTWNFHVMTFAALNYGSQKPALNVLVVVIVPVWVFSYVIAFFCSLSSDSVLLIKTLEIHPLHHRMKKLITLVLHLCIFMHPCMMGYKSLFLFCVCLVGFC